MKKVNSMQHPPNHKMNEMKKHLSVDQLSKTSIESQGKTEEIDSPSKIHHRDVMLNNAKSPEKLGLQNFSFGEENTPKEEDNLMQPKEIEKKEEKSNLVLITKQDKLITNILKEEDRSVGNVPFSMKVSFFKMMGGFQFVVIDVLLLIGIQVSNFIQQYEMQTWASKDDENRQLWVFLTIIAGFTLGSYCLTIIRQVMSICLKYFFTKKLHFAIHLSLLYASVNMFWDRVPIGRIVNRVSSDTGTVENQISRMTSGFF